MFFRFVDHRDAGAGARVTFKDVDKAVEYAKEKLVRNYDLNNNGLSQEEIARMSRTGKLAVEHARELKQAAAARPGGPISGKRAPTRGELRSVYSNIVRKRFDDAPHVIKELKGPPRGWT